jgi:hypothetical protein
LHKLDRGIQTLAAARRLQSAIDVRTLLATCLVAGCSFEQGQYVEPGGDPGDPVDDVTLDAGTTTASKCKFDDTALRLCIEFEDGVYSPRVTDNSTYKLDANASNINEWLRFALPAAATYWESSLQVPEHAMLDVSGAITVESWTRIPIYHLAGLIRNQGQYTMWVDTNGRLNCSIGGVSATAPTSIGADVWRHVACTFDGATLKLYVDGGLARCATQTGTIAVNGTTGTRLAGGLTGAIDDIRIYARALAETEICSHADKTPGCPATCP